MAVVACSPVPNAPAAGIMTSRVLDRSPFRVLRMVRRFPIRSGFTLALVAKRARQSLGNCSMAPPYRPRSNRTFCRDEDETSSRRRLHFGNSITARPQFVCSCRLASLSTTHCDDANLRQRYITTFKIPLREMSAATVFEINLRECLRWRDRSAAAALQQFEMAHLLAPRAEDFS